MAHHRRSLQHQSVPSSSASSPKTTRRKYLLRRVPSRLDSHASAPDSPGSRPVLHPLLNTRRLSSRSNSIGDKEGVEGQKNRMREHPVQIGAKRKRVVSNNENAHTNGRSTRTKRLKINGVIGKRYSSGTTSEESVSEESEMEVDSLSAASWSDEESEPAEENEEQGSSGEESDELDETDEYLLHSAPQSELNRQKKTQLCRLYRAGNLPEDPELLTKAEIISVIMDHRQDNDDTISLPPSSPPGRSEAASSDYANSSDEGNVAGGEETDALPRNFHPAAAALRRRATLNEIPLSPARPLKNRSLSMGNVLVPQPHAGLKRKASLRIQTEGVTRQRTSKESSPSTSAKPSSRSTSPPGHRLRSRKVSATTPLDPPSSTPTSATTSKGKGKGKTKHVEFSTEVVEARPSSSRKNSQKERERQQLADVLAEESELTTLESDDEGGKRVANLSPRRLRSKDRQRSQEGGADADVTPIPRKRLKQADGQPVPVKLSKMQPLRALPKRRAKSKIATLRESDVDEEGLEEELVDGEDEEEEDDVEEVEMDDVEEDEGEEEDEVDELVYTPPSSNFVPRKTPLRQRLRSRLQPVVSEAEAEAVENEGDDEHEDDDDDEEEVTPSEAADMQDDEDVETLVTEPRRLRNGKVVGDDDGAMDDEDEDEETVGEEEDEDTASQDGEEAEEDEGEQIAVDTEDDAEEDAMEDEVDLTVATAKTLVRLRRDDLVRLCEARDLEPVGTKPQLADALLQWRDRQNDSAPSSTGTIRPPSTGNKRRRKKQSDRTVPTTPVLLRSNKVHLDEPLTPVPGTSKEKESEELELDLESLGLEDREIPPEKIVKLEKIGSGGFKDVFIGKFKGRKIAISEFRGTLSAMDIKELKLLGGFDHPNIVRFLGVSIPENTRDTPVMIVSELCSNGDLFDYVRNVSPPSLHKVLVIMLDIASGLEYLHMRKPSIIHRDCKSSNILITAKGVAKIADFGLAKVKQSTRSMVKSLVGTVNWQAPELWTAHPKYNHKVDVFSCAMVYWEMMQWHMPNKKYPWEGMNEHAIYEQVGAKKHRPSIAGLKKQWCPEIVELMERMWAQDHVDRPTMSEVVEELRALVKQY